MKGEFDVRLVCIVLAVTGFLVFAVAPAQSYEPYLGAVCCIVAAYVWYFFDSTVRVITDPKQLYDYFTTQTATGSFPFTVPQWADLPPDDRLIHSSGKLILYVWWEGALRRACLLNMVIAKDVPMVKRLWSKKVNRQAVSDWRDDAIKEAFGYEEKKTERDEIEDLRSLGYEVTWKGKKDVSVNPS